jgi:hypothetical protein
VYARYPNDREAAVFYALSLLPNEATVSTEKGYGNQIKAGAILEKVFAEQPNHPGAAHYIIHAYDHPELASRALPAARLYAKIAPASDHALHMPSHIFTRLGLWQEAIDSNVAAAAAAYDYALKINPGATAPVPLHMLHFLMEDYLQVAQDANAKKVLEELKEGTKTQLPSSLNAAVIIAGVPARYAIERKQWKEAANLQPIGSRFTYAEAITYFARAIGAARDGDAANARRDVSKLESLRDELSKTKDEYWAQETEILRLAADGWLKRANGDNNQAVELLRAAAALEDSTQQHHTARDPIVPARELLADLLMETGRPGEALAEYETSLKKQPNRFNALYGAGHAAELSADSQKAKGYYAQLLKVCVKADSSRPELQRATTILATK